MKPFRSIPRTPPIVAAILAASALGTVSPAVPAFVAPLSAQQAPGTPASQIPPSPRSPDFGPTPSPSKVERVSPDVVRIGPILVNTSEKEFSLGGVVNSTTLLEFLSNTKDGYKAYESAFELDANAIDFNVACLLIGLDSTGAVPPRYQFDPQPPRGKPVELFVQWDDGGARKRVRAEQTVYNKKTKQTLSEGPWIYTGSGFVENRYLAQLDGTLVGFMHSPSPIIESARTVDGEWGDFVLNPQINLKPGTRIEFIVRALPATGR